MSFFSKRTTAWHTKTIDDLTYGPIEMLEDHIENDDSQWVDVSLTENDGNETHSEGNDDGVYIIEKNDYKQMKPVYLSMTYFFRLVF